MKNIVLISAFILSFPLSGYAADEDQPKNTSEMEQTSNPDSSSSQALSTIEMKRTEPDLRRDQRKDIAQYLKDSLTQVITLTALEEEFDTYYYAADAKEPIGSLLFFPDERTHADWAINLNPLRTKLTKHKWQTAVITLPLSTIAPLPQRSVYTTVVSDTASSAPGTAPTDDASTPSTDTDTDTTEETSDTEDTQKKPMAEIVAARANAVASMLKEKSDVLIITGIGQGATWAIAYALTLPEADLENTRLLLINPQQSEDISAAKINEMISELKVDTFDIYTPTNSNAYFIDQALVRKRAANLSEVEMYSQIKAPKITWQAQGNDWLYRKVRGLLKTKVAMALAEKKEKKMKAKAPSKMNQKPGST